MLYMTGYCRFKTFGFNVEFKSRLRYVNKAEQRKNNKREYSNFLEWAFTENAWKYNWNENAATIWNHKNKYLIQT